MLIGGFGALVLILGAVWLGARALTRPITRMTETMQVLAEGDFSMAVPYANQKDEIGAMARAVTVFKEKRRKGRADDRGGGRPYPAGPGRTRADDGRVAGRLRQCGRCRGQWRLL
jgi:HAMP domain-containing protein